MEAFDTNEYHVTLFGHGNRIVFIPEKAGSAERISEMVGQDIVLTGTMISRRGGRRDCAPVSSGTARRSFFVR